MPPARLKTRYQEEILPALTERFGYSTPMHAEALTRLGPCVIHRRSFSPVAVAQAVLSGEVVESGPIGWFGGYESTVE